MRKSEKSLSINNLSVKIGDKDILKDVSFDVKKGTVHVLMGPNGSGKSTVANVLMGHPDYLISSKSSKILLDGVDITDMETDSRARLGLFMAFQSPVAIPGVSVLNLLRTAYESSKMVKKISSTRTTSLSTLQKRALSKSGMDIGNFIGVLKKKAKELSIPESLLSRGINDGFSGGERKKIEILSACILKPKYAIFDEIDTGLDVDALRIVAHAIFDLANEGCGVIVITHYQRLLKYLTPDTVHILVSGKMVKHGNSDLAKRIEKNGYKKYSSLKTE